MTKKNADETAARALQKQTDWSYEMCLALVHQNPNATVSQIIAKRTPLSGPGASK